MVIGRANDADLQAMASTLQGRFNDAGGGSG